MSDIRQCPRCGTELKAVGVFCPSCGANTAAESAWVPPGGSPSSSWTPPAPQGWSPPDRPPPRTPPPPSSSWTSRRVALVTGGLVLAAALAFAGLVLLSPDERSTSAVDDEDLTVDEQDWRYPEAGSELLAGEHALYQVLDGKVEAIDYATGDVMWQTPICPDANLGSTPTAAPADVILAFCNNLAFLLDSRTGNSDNVAHSVRAELGQFAVYSDRYAIFLRELPFPETPIDVDVVPFEHGDPLWTTGAPLEDVPDPEATPVAVVDDVVVVWGPATVTAYGFKEGNVRWSVALGSVDLCAGSHSVFVQTVLGEVVALDAATGAELWRTGADYRERRLRSCTQQSVLLEPPAGIEVLEAEDGTARWTAAGPEPPLVLWTTTRRVVAWSEADQTLTVFDRETGAVVPHGFEVGGRPAVHDDRLYYVDAGEIAVDPLP